MHRCTRACRETLAYCLSKGGKHVAESHIRLLILAYGRNGAPMSREEGAPLRLYSAVKLGYKMVKWVDEVVFQPVRTGGYWEDLGYEWFAGV